MQKRSELTQALQTVLQNAIEKKELCGANVLVVKDGRELCRLEEGLADVGAGKKMQRDTIFRLYSMSKPVTAVAAMLLVERGILCLQTPVEEYLPTFRRAGAARPLCISHLLNMTSGLTYDDGPGETGKQTQALLAEAEESLCGEAPMTTWQFADKAGHIPLLFEPGTAWQYGTSADIMGAVIEQAAGKTFGAFLEDELFRPLGMQDTAFSVPRPKQARLAKAYETGAGGTPQEYTGSHLGIRNRMDEVARFESGGAGLVSTIDDYEKFARMLLQKGQSGTRQILRPQTVEYLTRGQLSEKQQSWFNDKWANNSGYSYGNFMRVLWNPWQASTLGRPMEYGWDGWLGCSFANCPQENLTLLVMQQQKDAGRLVERLRNVLFSHNL